MYLRFIFHGGLSSVKPWFPRLLQVRALPVDFVVFARRHLFEPDVDGRGLKDDGHVNQLTEDGSLGNEDAGVADVRQEGWHVVQTHGDEVTVKIERIIKRMLCR